MSALWTLAAVAVVVRVSVMFGTAVGLTQSAQGFTGSFLDFRDTVVTPGRYLLGGGNPYDPDAYLAANPWALPFSLYCPVWLVLGVLLAPLPFPVAIVLFQAVSVAVAVVFLRVICRWALPTLADIAVPAGLVWLNIWYPGRGVISVQLASLLGALGVALLLRAIVRRGETPDREAAAGVALGLLKPQFGVTVVVAAAAGRWRDLLRGVAGLAVISLPVVVALSVAAGGPLRFLRSVARDLAVSNSAAAPSGLHSPIQRRFDLVGQLARWGIDPPSWLQVGVLVLAIACIVAVVRLTRHPLALSAVVCGSTLVGVYHAPYDLVLMLIPVAAGVGMAMRGELTAIADRIALAASVLVVLHLHTVSIFLLPLLDVRLADTIDIGLVLIAVGCGLYTAVRTRRTALVTTS